MEVGLKIAQAALAVLTGLAVAIPAWAGPLETARDHEQEFNNAIVACNPADAAELYEDDAVAIYPGASDIGRGKDQITKLLQNFTVAFCPNDQHKAALKDVSFAASPLGEDYISVIRVIDATDKSGNHALLRSTKVLHRLNGQWRYLVDHTSVGLAASPGGGQ
jgi:ketosteroid isomerase-like protein